MVGVDEARSDQEIVAPDLLELLGLCNARIVLILQHVFRGLDQYPHRIPEVVEVADDCESSKAWMDKYDQLREAVQTHAASNGAHIIQSGVTLLQAPNISDSCK